ncbi:uncharacterized LabA/DUF88 family protein [Leucobacter exalbidus]|uniref:Uncharacterized LabA/DUF88 family protein n=1 Tax=Leucobacter exalbidus TaxID=662960 RepID=A0A940PK51_9MICO|nr:uncharacterized LabA/DUF88 family protein [Leucobacter exalbidus]
MADNQNGRVAVYLDFDNIVLSWYDRVHGRNSFGRDRHRISENPNDPEVVARLEAAAIDVGAIIDYASSYGTLVLTRGYADWSAPVNAQYRSQLVARAVDLVQLFPTAAYAKNGADIRLAVDTVEDMFRLEDLTHVVIVAGDSDYVPLAQRCRRLGRYVVGIGVAGSTAKALTAACDDFATYDTLPGVERPGREEKPARSGRGRGRVDPAKTATGQTAQTADGDAGELAGATTAASGAGAEALGNGAGSATAAEAGTAGTAETAGAETSAPEKTGNSRSRSRRGSRASGAASRAAAGANGGSGSGSGANTGTDAAAAAGDAPSSSAQPAKADQGEGFADEINSALDALDTHDTHGDHDEHDLHDDGDAGDRVGDRTEDDEYEITGLLIRALWLGQEKDDSDWLHSSAVKQQMRRMDSSFNEKVLGFRSFSDFLKSRSDVAEVSGSGHERLVRLREQSDD